MCKINSLESFDKILKEYKDYIYTLSYGILQNSEDAKDVTQETFFKIYINLDSFSGTSIKTWIGKIAKNTSIDYLRKNKKMDNLTNFEDYILKVKSSVNIEENIISKITKDKLITILNLIPEKYSTILRKYYFQNKSYDVISREENISIRTVESRLYRGKKILREKWEEENNCELL